ncbi:protein BIG GRAIN 1-like A [Rhodamnia argentea]|uniref:Protein BIG GRAIN 1-like A n=1 Tax=Rhodamnia argentea TaxID=178133 RepID=A0A8B8PUG7_9MYRT|nr:protein BIG GRAIN 1-like A [Rhodamnia argentea]
MYKSERTLKEERYAQGKQNPSFSSTLLDKIYRSIDESDPKGEDLKFYGDAAMARKQSIRDLKKCSSKSNKCAEENLSLHRGVFVSSKVGDDGGLKTRQIREESERKQRRDRDHDHDHDALFFSSTSSSSDSSSGGFSSSDTESIYGVVKTRSSCFAPPPLPRQKPLRTSSSTKPEKTERALFQEQKKLRDFDHHRHNSSAEQSAYNEEGMIKSKSRALKIYANLKKVKQPISPGGRLSNFINSLFTATNTKKPKSTPAIGSYGEPNAERKSQSAHESVCSSASSFSRSCLSKHSPATRQKLQNGVKRTVRFYPVSVIVDEDCRPCGHKSLFEEDHGQYGSNSMPVLVPSAWKIGGRLPTSRKTEETEEAKCRANEKSRRVEEAARDFLRDYYQNQKKVRNDSFAARGHREIHRVGDVEGDYRDDDDDAASCSSSDLFELDHLAVIGNERYCEELPVYETTHVGANRAIANRLFM